MMFSDYYVQFAFSEILKKQHDWWLLGSLGYVHTFRWFSKIDNSDEKSTIELSFSTFDTSGGYNKKQEVCNEKNISQGRNQF